MALTLIAQDLVPASAAQAVVERLLSVYRILSAENFNTLKLNTHIVESEPLRIWIIDTNNGSSCARRLTYIRAILSAKLISVY